MQNGLTMALALLIVGNILAWMQGNLQFVSEWWYSRPFFTIMLFSMPTALCFYFGWRFMVEYFDQSLWSARLFSFGIGTVLFAFMSYFIKNEGLTKKTLICLLLSASIVLIQVFWDEEASPSKLEELTD
jgi:hypothetical protein